MGGRELGGQKEYVGTLYFLFVFFCEPTTALQFAVYEKKKESLSWLFLHQLKSSSEFHLSHQELSRSSEFFIFLPPAFPEVVALLARRQWAEGKVYRRKHIISTLNRSVPCGIRNGSWKACVLTWLSSFSPRKGNAERRRSQGAICPHCGSLKMTSSTPPRTDSQGGYSRCDFPQSLRKIPSCLYGHIMATCLSGAFGLHSTLPCSPCPGRIHWGLAPEAGVGTVCRAGGPLLPSWEPSRGSSNNNRHWGNRGRGGHPAQRARLPRRRDLINEDRRVYISHSRSRGRWWKCFRQKESRQGDVYYAVGRWG